jgi:hypothetical protein
MDGFSLLAYEWHSESFFVSSSQFVESMVLITFGLPTGDLREDSGLAGPILSIEGMLIEICFGWYCMYQYIILKCMMPN